MAETFVAESLEGVCFINGKKHYFVKWVGYDEDQNTWEPVQHLKALIEEMTLFDKEYDKDIPCYYQTATGDLQIADVKPTTPVQMQSNKKQRNSSSSSSPIHKLKQKQLSQSSYQNQSSSSSQPKQMIKHTDSTAVKKEQIKTKTSMMMKRRNQMYQESSQKRVNIARAFRPLSTSSSQSGQPKKKIKLNEKKSLYKRKHTSSDLSSISIEAKNNKKKHTTKNQNSKNSQKNTYEKQQILKEGRKRKISQIKHINEKEIFQMTDKKQKSKNSKKNQIKLGKEQQMHEKIIKNQKQCFKAVEENHLLQKQKNKSLLIDNYNKLQHKDNYIKYQDKKEEQKVDVIKKIVQQPKKTQQKYLICIQIKEVEQKKLKLNLSQKLSLAIKSKKQQIEKEKQTPIESIIIKQILSQVQLMNLRFYKKQLPKLLFIQGFRRIYSLQIYKCQLEIQNTKKWKYLTKDSLMIFYPQLLLNFYERHRKT